MIIKKLVTVTAAILTVTVVFVSPTFALDDHKSMRASYERPQTVPFPEENQYSDEKAALGKLLFFDPRLSKENNLS